MDSNTKKTALRMVTYGLYVVTTTSPTDRAAFLCNWLTQCAFEPLLIVVAVENDAHSLQVLRDGGHFVVNVLETGQTELAGWFGRHYAKVGDKLANRELLATPSGLPVLPEALSWFECKVVSEMLTGDHALFVAEVVDVAVLTEGRTPLTLKETGFRYAG